MTYDCTATTVNDLLPGSIFEDEGGGRYVKRAGPCRGGWLPALDLSTGEDCELPQEFLVWEIVLDPPIMPTSDITDGEASDSPTPSTP